MSKSLVIEQTLDSTRVLKVDHPAPLVVLSKESEMYSVDLHDELWP